MDKDLGCQFLTTGEFMIKELQAHTRNAKKEVAVHYSKHRQILAMRELELIRANLNREHEQNMKQLEAQHQQKMMSAETEAQRDKHSHQLRMVELKYIKEDVHDAYGAKKDEFILRLQALLKTEEGIIKLEQLMHNDNFCELLSELLPDVYSQLCEVFQINQANQRFYV